MAKEVCPNCNAKMTRPVSFCPVCSRPTSHATDTERMEWDLGQWRRHVERSVTNGSTAAVAVTTAPPRGERAPARDLQVVREPEPLVEQPREKRQPRKLRLPELPTPALRLSTRTRPEGDRVIVLDSDHAFMYTACTSCERTDWIVRYGRNEDGTYNYWCVRCSRSFKTDAKLSHALRPFLASGSVIGAIGALAIIMR